jgi:hypothetical protein
MEIIGVFEIREERNNRLRRRAKQGQYGRVAIGCPRVQWFAFSHVRPLAEEAEIHPPVIASAAKQSRLPPRKDSGLLRCARNDGE